MKLQVLKAEMSMLGVLGGKAGNRKQVVQSVDTIILVMKLFSLTAL
jgi:hypothetical protein